MHTETMESPTSVTPDHMIYAYPSSPPVRRNPRHLRLAVRSGPSTLSAFEKGRTYVKVFPKLPTRVYARKSLWNQSIIFKDDPIDFPMHELIVCIEVYDANPACVPMDRLVGSTKFRVGAKGRRDALGSRGIITRPIYRHGSCVDYIDVKYEYLQTNRFSGAVESRNCIDLGKLYKEMEEYEEQHPGPVASCVYYVMPVLLMLGIICYFFYMLLRFRILN